MQCTAPPPLPIIDTSGAKTVRPSARQAAARFLLEAGTSTRSFPRATTLLPICMASPLPVGSDHLVVLPPRNREIELQSHPLGALAHGVARLPSEMIDGPDQHIAQCAVFAVDAPGVERSCAAPLDSPAQLHRKISPLWPGAQGHTYIIPIRGSRRVPAEPQSGRIERLPSCRYQTAGIFQILVLECVDRPVGQRAQSTRRVPRGI